MDSSRSSISLIAEAGLLRAVPKTVRFLKFSGYVTSDGERLVGQEHLTTIDMSSANAGSSIDTRMLKAQILKPSDYPTSSFHIQRISSLGGGRYQVHGALEMIGIKRSESYLAKIDFKENGVHLRSEAFTIQKSNYGMSPSFRLNDDIEIKFDLWFHSRD